SYRQIRRPLEDAANIGFDLRIGYIDGDLNDDIVATFGSSVPNALELAALLSNGDGTFRRMPGHAIVGGITGLAVADFTGDRIPDAIVSNYFSLSFLRGKGDGTFG